MDTARIIEVIESTIARRGDGKTDPVRIITQYFDRDGNLLAENDPVPAHESEIARLKDAIQWALGENGSFREREVLEGEFWWRTELRRRAGL